MNGANRKKKDFQAFQFKCSCCDEIHKGMPSLGTKAPISYFAIPPEDRKQRVVLTSDTCIIDEAHFFVRGCLELPVADYEEALSFGAWVSLSEGNFARYEDLFKVEIKSHEPPMFGWFSSWIWPFYEGEVNLKSRIHLRDEGIRPWIELEPTEHPLALAQREGISKDQVIRIFEYYVHGKKE